MKKRHDTRAILPAFFLSLLLLGSSACSTGTLLMGNVNPVEQKSESYGVLDLSKDSSVWSKLDPANNPGVKDSPDARTTEVSDVAYQSRKNASIISINSACRPSAENQDLRAEADVLFYGISDVSLRQEVPMTVQHTPALQTTVQGKLNDQPMMLRAVVLRRGPCLYDLLYVARPQHFAENEADFSHFVASLKLKE